MFADRARMSGRVDTSGCCRILAGGTALITATAVLIAPPVPRHGAVSAANVQLTAATPLAELDATALTSPDAVPTAAELLDFADAAQALVPGAAASGIGGFIESVYLGGEQWVRYGVSLLAWLVGWIPLAGLLGPQINFFYDLGEAMVRSVLFNTIDWLSGSIGFGQALSNIGSDTGAAFDNFFTAQENWLRHFLPPAPPGFPTAEAIAPDLDASSATGLDPTGLDPTGLDPTGLDPAGLDPTALDLDALNLLS